MASNHLIMKQLEEMERKYLQHKLQEWNKQTATV
jgi:hypothetical protein